MKKLLSLSILLLSTLILGGCLSTGVPKPTITTTTTQNTVVKKPVAIDEQSKYYNFCEDKGHEIIIRFDEKVQKAKIYCRFKDTTECDAEAFLKGTCGPGKGSVAYQADVEKLEPVSCPQNYDPVCGEDNFTYSNYCYADIKKIKIKSKGVCPIVNAPDVIITNPSANTTNNVPATPGVLDNQPPVWLDLAIALTQSDSVHSPRSFIDKCSYAGVVVYYQTAGNEGISSLYDADGQIMCYPNNDLSKSCPAYFNPSNRGTNCIRLWTDAR